ncbi:hypothetical protein O6H91_10G077800 [Diphasiastrum complanatum]|nr:hypothetical protein O6H91_10G077800 [Diphasiastrum complanatum]
MPLVYNERHEMAIVRGGRHLFTKVSGTMGPGCRICFLLVVITIFINITTCDADLLSDNQTLLAFKASVDMNGKLENWSQGSPCDGNWYGVACQDGRVAHLVLENIGLTGPITVLSSLDQLRVLSLMGNSLNGSLPDMSNWANLKLLYLNENNFRGEIPPSVSALVHALRIDLSNNKLIGPIPDSFSSLTHLATLRLENNFLSGMLPSLNLTLLNDFNVSGNELSGRIPITLRNFDISAYAGNPELCGYPVSACNFSLPPISSVNLQPPSPSVLPCSPMTRPTDERLKKASGNRLSVGVIAAIVVGDASVLLIVIVMFLFYYWKRYSRRLDRTTSKFLESEKGEFSSDQHSVQVPEVKKSKLVFFDWKKPMFDLEDLLRASAEMLGKGSLGTAYKAVLEDGTIVAVKRLKEVNVSGRKEFEQQMELIGNTQHSHLVQLRAYYYAKEEKLLVYDYLPNGSLYSLLHG